MIHEVENDVEETFNTSETAVIEDPHEWAKNARKPYWRGLGVRVQMARYTELERFYMRLVDVALEEARDVKDGLPTDDAVLAVDWLFRAADPKGDRVTFLMSIDNCAAVLGVDVRRLRGNIRLYLRRFVSIYAAQVDKVRLNRLLSEPIDGDEIELFHYPRAVPALDQLALFTPETVH